MDFRYQLDTLTWSDWKADTSVLLYPLLEGEHLFQVQGKYFFGTEDDTPAEHEFLVEYIYPITNIISGPTDGSTVDTSIVTFVWEVVTGTEYSYSFDGSAYSNWSTLSTVTYDELTEGTYTFNIKSRFDPLIEEETPTTINFTVDYFRPTTIITSPASGQTIDTTSVEFTWEVQEGAECRYALNSTGFTEWATITSITYQYLDEGQHTFSVQSRFNPLIEEETPVSINFTVDALQGPGLRVYMLKTNAAIGEEVELYIYAEEFESVMAVEFQIEYDNSILNPISLSQGDLLLESSGGALFITDIADDVIEVNLGLLDGETINGSGALLQLTFEAIGAGSSTIEIQGSVFQDLDGTNIPVSGTLNGLVVVE